MTFKQTIATTLTTLLLCTGVVANACGQVIVTGHITAEVIESAHASSTVVTTSTLTSEQVNTESLQLNGTYRNTNILNLGAVTIHTGLNTVCDIKLHEATLSDNNGNSFTIKPASITSGQSDTLLADGSQTLLLNGTASLGHGYASGLYKGSYTVVVLYN
jgi:hypothetical protein